MELKIVVDQWLHHVGGFEVTPGFVPQITWPSATCALQRLPLVITGRKGR
jgi:hypothetical protein